MNRCLRSCWRTLRKGRPGQRFQDLHVQRQAQRGSRWSPSRVVLLATGGLLVIAGPIAGLVPGPGGVIVFLAGLALLASELRFVARWLDWCEPRLRRGWSFVRRAWRRARIGARVALCVAGAAAVGTCVLAARAYVAFGA